MIESGWMDRPFRRGAIAEEIPLTGRITTVVDVFDALTRERPYKEAWPLERAVAEIAEQRDDQFDPRIVHAFVSIQEHMTDAAIGTDVASSITPAEPRPIVHSRTAFASHDGRESDGDPRTQP